MRTLLLTKLKSIDTPKFDLQRVELFDLTLCLRVRSRDHLQVSIIHVLATLRYFRLFNSCVFVALASQPPPPPPVLSQHSASET